MNFFCVPSSDFLIFLIQGVGLSIHAGLPGVPGHVGHGDEEQGCSAEDEQGEGGAGACK